MIAKTVCARCCPIGCSEGRAVRRGPWRTGAVTLAPSSSTSCAPRTGTAGSPNWTSTSSTSLVAALDAFEAAVSSERRDVEHQLDELTEEFVSAVAATTSAEGEQP